ncbi:hypothetical protein DFH07DRAFT_965021 [Mycena maculata]|uniref:RING-type domain-containing protein n=1 Tax=Mycena maculata TaxID=230809 RepID=A0AAD7IEU1_9AGAR|nr:hypothetical protein DFH07DRAFT_965021 [Mycena maculata]
MSAEKSLAAVMDPDEEIPELVTFEADPTAAAPKTQITLYKQVDASVRYNMFIAMHHLVVFYDQRFRFMHRTVDLQHGEHWRVPSLHHHAHQDVCQHRIGVGGDNLLRHTLTRLTRENPRVGGGSARGPPSSILQLGQLASDAEDDAAARDMFAGRGRGPNDLAARLEAVHGRIRAMQTVSPEAHNRLQRALSLTPVQMVAERRQRARGDRKNTVSPLYRRLARKERAYPGGARELREEPLTRENLWVDGTRPNVQVPRAAHHKCEICKMTKSHPVSSECGHSFCYVCIRVSLETDWKCPVCSVHMLRAPFQHEAEEAFLKAEYPDWQDNSTVEYKWDGLCFPKLVSIIPVEDSP